MNKTAALVTAIASAVQAATVRLSWGDDGRISKVAVFGIPFYDRKRREKRLTRK